MHRYELSDEQWDRIRHHFPPNGGRGGQWRDHRSTVNGILWVLCSGAPWRDLPGRYGPWQTVYERFADLRRSGRLAELLSAL